MLDVRKSPELQAALLGVRSAQRVVQREINKDARGRINPDWLEALRGTPAGRAGTRIIVQGARTSVNQKGVTVKAATSTKPLSGGLVPSYNWQGEELGMTPKLRTFPTTSRKGRRYNVTKTVGRQFPARTKQGRIAYAAASEVGVKLVGYWVRTVVDHFKLFADVKSRY